MPAADERNIQVAGMPRLDSFELGKINNALALTYDKLQKIVGNRMLLVLHFKECHKEGRREKHSVHLRLSFPGKTVVATETGWSPVPAVQSALHVLERETIESVKARR